MVCCMVDAEQSAEAAAMHAAALVACQWQGVGEPKVNKLDGMVLDPERLQGFHAVQEAT